MADPPNPPTAPLPAPGDPPAGAGAGSADEPQGPDPEAAGGPPPPRRWVLRRSVRDRKLKGVAGGVAAAADVDPTLVRLLFAVAAFSGWGIVAYLVFALVLQDETAEDRARPLHPDQRRPLRIGLGIAAFLAVGRLVGGPFFTDGDLGLPFLLIAVGAALLWARRDQTPAGLPPDGTETWIDPAAPVAPGPWPSAAPAPPLGAGIDWRSTAQDLLRLAAAFVAVGALLALVAGTFLVVVGAVPMRLPLLPAAVGMAGVLALVVAVVRRARPVGLFLSGGVLVAAAALAVGLASFPGGDTGTRVVVVGPGTPLLDRYEHSAGRLVLDLRGFTPEPTGPRRVVAEVGIGQLSVIVSPALTTDVRARLGLGGANLFGRAEGGPGLNVTARHDGGAEASHLDLDLDVGLGEITVELAPEPTFDVTCTVPAAAKGDGTDPVTCPRPTRLAGTAMACSVNLIDENGGPGDGRAFCRRLGGSVPPVIGRFAASCTVSAEGVARCDPLSSAQRDELEGVRRGPAPPAPPGTAVDPAAPVPPAAPALPAAPAATAAPTTVAGGGPLVCGAPDATGERLCTATPASATTTTVATFRCREDPATSLATCVPA